MNANQLTWHDVKITKKDRQQLNGHRSAVLWLTGLSGSGKSTLAVEVEKKLYEKGLRTYVLDGDNIRHGLNNNLGFSPEDRKENIRRIGEVSKLFVDAGIITLASFISPYRDDRQMVREWFNDKEFIEVYVKCDLIICEQRDPKGLYQRARKGEIKEFTGIDAPYEVPEKAEIIIETGKLTIEESVQEILQYLKTHKYIY
ncbi:adenylyl-sulfate kinase [Lederbergia citrea]|uniref:Adenylyl-sulfate kinase n=1 Tax=Lederbergia citrea TaxID=2833581 RepID=A0A942UI85_9BACI|nr:adenylyl-sulfate kinase [Lederbergia citrea]MBS4176806.1 adenylyl-sulfate kinase [Lederbergia citrea]MBS4203366.1 adenylyl-sulfate kinase [Lederbergia citrea]MBS4221961.1 adenylyl-sulfate kinase [Lederbergia citrea]